MIDHRLMVTGKEAVMTIIEKPGKLPIVCVEGLRLGYYLRLFRFDEGYTQVFDGMGAVSEKLEQTVKAVKEKALQSRSVNIPYDDKNGAMIFYLDHKSMQRYINQKLNINLDLLTRANKEFSHQELRDIVSCIEQFVLEHSGVAMMPLHNNPKSHRRCDIL